jgi:hypothetical protein
MTRFLGVVGVVWVSLWSVARAELPPLSDEQRRAEADLVVIGDVVARWLAIETPHEGFVNVSHVLQVRVTSTEKGEAPAGKVVYLHTWTAQRRPAGWVGPGGQVEVPAVGQVARFFARTDEHGVRTLLLPNGVEPNPSPPATQPTTEAAPENQPPEAPPTAPPAEPAPADAPPATQPS